MKAQLFGTFCTTLILSFLWIVSAAGQSDISVNGADATFTPANYGAPTTGLATILQRVTQRLGVDYSNATFTKALVNLPAEMRVALTKVAPNLSVDFASATRTATLAYPKALVNDQTAPVLIGTIRVEPSSAANLVIISWQANEPTKSTFEYGTAPGSYSQTFNDGSFQRSNRAEIDNLTPNATYYGRLTLTDRSDNQTVSPEFTFSLTPTTGKPLVLVYAALDNNLGTDGDQLRRFIRNVERGAANPDITVRLFVDHPGTANAYSYELSGSPCITANATDPTCGGRYVEGTNFWRESENAAHPNTLYTFVNRAVTAHSDASHIVLSLVGHGSGWSANALPSQPSSWVDQPSESGTNQDRLGGFLWDDTLGSGSGAQSISTQTLGVALQWINGATGRKIDLLYLDACSMGMAEVADEIAPYVDYLLASPNTAWTSFSYDKMLNAVTPTMSGEAIGLAWLDAEKGALDARRPEYPYTLALYQLDQMETVATTVKSWVTDLLAAMAGPDRAAIEAAYQAMERYESDYDGKINTTDHYGDLGSFLRELQGRIAAEQPVATAAVALLAALDQLTVGEAAFGNGEPYPYPGETWAWSNASGLAIYAPNANDAKRTLYSGDNLRWVQRTNWDQFLAGMGVVVAADTTATLPTCTSTTSCEELPQQLPVEEGGTEIYLPIVMR